MLAALRFLGVTTSGHRLCPWRSPYLRWRIETYSGMKADEIGSREFWQFVWGERSRLWRFLGWVGKMEKYRKV